MLCYSSSEPKDLPKTSTSDIIGNLMNILRQTITITKKHIFIIFLLLGFNQCVHDVMFIWCRKIKSYKTIISVRISTETLTRLVWKKQVCKLISFGDEDTFKCKIVSRRHNCKSKRPRRVPRSVATTTVEFNQMCSQQNQHYYTLYRSQLCCFYVFAWS